MIPPVTVHPPEGTVPQDAFAYDTGRTNATGNSTNNVNTDGNGTTVTEGDLAGGSAIGGPGGNAEIFSNTANKTGSSDFTEETKAGTSSGSAQILVGVTTAVS